VTFQMLISFLTIENNNLNIQSEKRVTGTAFTILVMFFRRGCFFCNLF